MKPVLSLCGAMAVGAATLVPANRWWPWLRTTYVVAPGVLFGSASVLLLSVEAQDKHSETPTAASARADSCLRSARSWPLPLRIGLSLGIGATLSAAQAGSLRADAGIERSLDRCGLTHPRRWMAAFTALVFVVPDIRGSRTAEATPRET